MGLSTDILWHQTTFDGLKKILESKSFLCSYSLETILWKSTELKRAFPMISFCDIPFSDMHEYLTDQNGKTVGKYGKYTIGMKRSWGISNGLSPVWYRDKDSHSIRIQKENFDNIKEKNPVKYTENEKFLWHVTACTKNHDGKLSKYGFSSYRFYDEREFRYIPDFDLLIKKGYNPFLTEEEYFEFKNKNNKTSHIKDLNITFQNSDIAYILVSQRNKITKVKSLFKGENIDKVVFMSYSQILNDVVGISHQCAY